MADEKMSLNDRIAYVSTQIFGTMWTTYAFAIYGLIGAIAPDWQPVLLYWSSWAQLWALPLLMVGGIVVNRASAAAAMKQAQETHDTVMEELQLLKDHLGVIEDAVDGP